MSQLNDCWIATYVLFFIVLQGVAAVLGRGPHAVPHSTQQQEDQHQHSSSQVYAHALKDWASTPTTVIVSTKHDHSSSSSSPCRHLLAGLRHLLREAGTVEGPWGALRGSKDPKRDRVGDNRATQANAFTDTKGPNLEDWPGDPFTAYSTEQSSISDPAGAYYDDTGEQVLALDPQIGIWGGSWSANRHYSPRRKFESMLNNRPTFVRQNPQESEATHRNITVKHFKLEASSQRGTQVLAGTFEGARSASGSGSSYNLARPDSLGGAASAHNNDAYGPTSGRATVVGADRRSVAFTDLPPNSAASAGTGYGVVASAAGWEVASTARSGSDPDVSTTRTIGHREPGDNGLLEPGALLNGRRLHRKLMRLLGYQQQHPPDTTGHRLS